MSISAPPRMVNELRAALELRATLVKQAAQRDPAQPSTSPVDSLLAYAQHMDRRYQPSWHHLAIIEKLEAVERGDIKRLMITMPPRHGKSLTVNLFSAWYLGRNPDHRIIATSYGQVLADRFSGQARSQIEDDRWPFRDVQLAQDTRSKRAWDLKGHYGGYLAAGVGAGITGHGAQLIIVDDPIRSDKDAKSAHIRDALWEWYTATLSTRLEDDGAIIVIQCMTGDTPVRMADGSDRPLRDIRIGDDVATYDRGALAASTVLNHASQGYDNVYRITMTSGKIVHANERHPFLVEEHGQRRWVRLKDLTTAHKIVTVRDNGASGRASSAPLRNAVSPSVLVGSASPITTSRSGRTGIVRPRSTRSQSANDTSSIGTVSPPQSMTRSCPRRAASVLSASDQARRVLRRTGAANSALTTITIPARYVDSSATTVISRRVASSQPKSPMPSPRTSDFTTEQIASIEPVGVAEVFDLQIAHTENFIANGLVSHNTRWHQDDLAGRLLRGDENEDDDFPEDEREDWVLLNLPAIALFDEAHREEGEALWPQRYPVSRLNRRHRLIGDYYWNALYQQTPTPAEGAIFQRPWFEHRFDPTDLSIRNRSSVRTITIDTAQKESASADYSAFCVGEMVGADGSWTLYLREVERERLTFPRLYDRTVQLAQRHNRDDKLGAVVIEDSANGSALIDELRASAPEWLANIVVPVRPRASKTIRAERITPLCRAGKVILPAPSEAVPWLYGFESELFDFPVAPHDDMVDAFVMLVDHWTHYLHEPYQLEEAA